MPAKKEVAAGEKDPGIAALISAVGLLLVAAPGVGYFYIGSTKKGLEYVIGFWALCIVVIIAYLLGGIIGGIITMGITSICCMPLFLVPLVVGLVIVWDVYLEAKGEPTKLPVV
jgi:hypothetical protein